MAQIVAEFGPVQEEQPELLEAMLLPFAGQTVTFDAETRNVRASFPDEETARSASSACGAVEFRVVAQTQTQTQATAFGNAPPPTSTEVTRLPTDPPIGDFPAFPVLTSAVATAGKGRPPLASNDLFYLLFDANVTPLLMCMYLLTHVVCSLFDVV
eukprot:GHVT01040906.1.p1 GENE.GHVT01040906.1~~GHVT01040906.1.p1  ORF type:complete len:156 (+),score=50.13 GHVT01040906.1:143-610(+)